MCSAPANPLLGTWYRDVGVGVLVATFTPDEMKLCVTPREGGDSKKSFTVTLTAHYTLTKDGLVYGAISGADMESKTGLNKDDADAARERAGVDRPPVLVPRETDLRGDDGERPQTLDV